MIDNSVAVSVSDLRKRYGGFFRRRVEALRGVSFDVPKGQVFGLLGPNGAGKTTIIKILLGIIRSSGGEAKLLGQPAGKAAGRRRVGYLPENLQLPAHQNARTALEYFGRLSGLDHATIKSRGTELLHQVGLAARQKESVKQYSKGMRQRLGLAQALLHKPELLILDEPTDGLDPVGRSQVRDIMRELSEQGCTVFLNSHLLQEVELVCDHVAILSKGQLLHVGSVQDLTTAKKETETDLTLEVSGQFEQQELESTLQQALDGRPAEFKFSALDSQTTSVQLMVRSQIETDRIVDALRRNGFSISSLYRRKMTLEDFFLSLVKQTPYQA